MASRATRHRLGCRVIVMGFRRGVLAIGTLIFQYKLEEPLPGFLAVQVLETRSKTKVTDKPPTLFLRPSAIEVSEPASLPDLSSRSRLHRAARHKKPNGRRQAMGPSPAVCFPRAPPSTPRKGQSGHRQVQPEIQGRGALERGVGREFCSDEGLIWSEASSRSGSGGRCDRWLHTLSVSLCGRAELLRFT